MKEKISRMQFFLMIPNILFGKAIGITAGVIVRKIGADVWTSMSIGFIAGTITVLLMVYVCSKFPEKTIIDYGQQVFGKWIGKFISFILVVYFAYAYAISANVITMHLKEYFLTETPFIVLCIVYTLVCSYGVILGVEVVIRFSLFGFIMLWLINITMVLGTIQDFRYVNLEPIFDKGLMANVLNSYYVFSDIAMVVLSIGIIYPMIDKKKNMSTITFLAMIASAVSIIVWPFFEVGVLGADVMKQFVVVCMQQVRSAQLTIYLPRYELIMVSFFVWSVFVQSVVMFWCSLYCFKSVFNFKRDRLLVLIMTPVLILLTNILGRDHNIYISFLAYPWSQLSALLSISLPLLFIIGIAIRPKLRKELRTKDRSDSKIR